MAEAGLIRKRVGTGLESAAKQSEETTQLDVDLATKEVARPHHEQSPGSTTTTEDTIGRGDDRRRDVDIALTIEGEVEVGIPSWLTDGTTDDGSTVTICLNKSWSTLPIAGTCGDNNTTHH